ncbi:MAG: hypothetical protein K2Q14_06720 [Gammaproteobacteria bacterium]|nr:hypothetical protein [Gammaproteobacteria bacterium]
MKMGLSTHKGQKGKTFAGTKNKAHGLILNAAKVVHLDQRAAVNDEKANAARVVEGSTEQTAIKSQTAFLNDFEAIVEEERQKTLDCIELIKQDIHHYRGESHVLRKQLYLESSAQERARLTDKIAANKEWIAECEERILLINQRASVLQKQLQILSLQSQEKCEINT